MTTSDFGTSLPQHALLHTVTYIAAALVALVIANADRSVSGNPED